jgi:(heptosyl)LPS beta-1,4-glucosyltransferase
MNPANKLSVVVIARDEVENIADCLRTASFADEIVVLDSGSEDDTVALARAAGARVEVESDWRGYGVQRQRAQQLAAGDWILMLDADERITPELAESIRAAVARDDRNVVYALPRLSWCFGRFIRHSGWYPDYVTRLYPRERARYSDDLVHESLAPDPGMRVQRLKGDLLHYTYRDIEHYLVKSAGYAAHWAQQRQAAGRKGSLWQGATHALACFLRMYVFRAGFLDGRQGLLLALLSAHSTFVKYADLWTRSQPEPPVDR